jgi:hypothetical protein
MAFVSQKMKKEMTPFIKQVFKKYGYKGTLKISHHSTLVANITEGPYSLEEISGRELHPHEKKYGEYSVNTHWIDDHFKHNEPVRDFLNALKAAMNGVGSKERNYDHSDVMTDYFDVGWYIDINFGNGWTNKPYKKVEVA